MRINASYLEHLPALLDRWVEDIDRLGGEAGLRPTHEAPMRAARSDPPAFSPPLEQWAEDIDRLLAG